ncbi:MAG: CoA-binding protein [Janthinobacterium lividum]
MNEPNVIVDMLGGSATGAVRAPRTLAVIGLSADPTRPSYSVSAYMQRAGYRLFPVNPAVDQVLGEQSYPTLRDLPIRPDLVNVFRLPRYIPAIVEEMIALGLRDLWVQLGIVHREAAERAEQAGLRVVMDRCILIEHRRLVAQGTLGSS